MRIIIEDCTLENFEAWSGAVFTKDKIIEADKESEFNSLIEELYPDGLTDVALNDLLRYEHDWIMMELNIHEDAEDDID